jgi:hypothetical protein
MSRPKDLPAALQSWANANYSAGPSWGGTPQRAAPGAAFLTPGITLPAENANYLYGNAFDAAQSAINAVGEMPALNWSGLVAVGITPVCVAWSDVEQAWYAFAGSASTVQRSADFGKVWAAGSALAVATGVFVDAAFDTSGNGVVVSNVSAQSSTFVAYGTALTWTNTAGALGAAGGATSLVFDAAHNIWCAVGTTNAVGAWAYTSTNRTAWTARSLPGTWTSTGTSSAQLGYGNGIIVASYTNAVTSQFRTARSTDGGITWTNDQAIVQNAGISIATGFPTTRPVWSATDALWYVAVYQQTVSRKTQIFSSPDGITWSVAATLLGGDCRFLNIQVIGSLLVAMNDDGRVFASWNQGANWFKCGAVGGSLNTNFPTYNFRGAGNGFLSISSASAIASQRFGLPLTAVT